MNNISEANGLHIEWGQTEGYDGEYQVNFYVTYTQIPRVIATTDSPAGNGYAPCINGISRSYVRIDAARGYSSNSKSAYWIAIGY